DVNENGVLDPGEPPQAGWNVSADSTHLGDYLLSQPTGTTDANGHYTIIGVQPGDPWIEAAGVGQWTITSPASNEYLVNVAAGQTVSGVNFATVPRFNTAHGNIFNDANRNGVRDVNESPLTNWTVYVDLNNNGVFDIYYEPQGITDSLGNFTVQGNFLLGDYTLRALPKQGWYPTMPPSGAITFKQTSTNPITGLNLGFVQS